GRCAGVAGCPVIVVSRVLAACWLGGRRRRVMRGGGAGRRSRQAPSLAANAGPLRASCPPLRTSPPHDAPSHRLSLGPPGRVCCAAANSAASAASEESMTCEASARTPQALATLASTPAQLPARPTTTSAGDGPGRWRGGPSAAAPARVRGGGVGGRRPGFGDTDAAEKPPWMGSRRPGRGPPTPPPP